jgi:hypothetical protein
VGRGGVNPQQLAKWPEAELMSSPVHEPSDRAGLDMVHEQLSLFQGHGVLHVSDK